MLLNFRWFVTFLGRRTVRNHSRCETKLPFKRVLIHFAKDFCFKCFIEHLYNFRSAIRGCYLLSFIQKSPLLIFKRRCDLFQMADWLFLEWNSSNSKRRVLLKQIWTHFTDRVGGMCDCGRQSIPTTGTVHHFPTGLRQFLPQGGHLRALGIVHHDHMDVPTWYFSKPICAIHAPGWFSCGNGDGCIYIGQKCLFQLRTDI